MQYQHLSRLLKIGTVFTLILGVVAAGLAGGQRSALAHEAESQVFMVHAGGHAPGNVEVLAFAPSVVQVHRGDTVMWHITNFHNVRFGEQPAELIIVPEVDGQPLPQMNPDIAFPSVENGGTLTNAHANSGLPIESPIFSLVIDLEPGRYMYFCDVHPGMVGVIEVVEDDVAIPSAGEVEARAQQELAEQMSAASAVYQETQASAQSEAVDGVVEVIAGSGNTGRVTINQFSNPVAVILAGESVTWVNPADGIEPHFVNSSPYDPVAVPEVIPVIQENAPPILSIGPGFLGTTPSGSVIGAGDTFNSAFILPGQSFTLTFSDPGVYLYNCHIHPNMNGVVVVQPAA